MTPLGPGWSRCPGHSATRFARFMPPPSSSRAEGVQEPSDFRTRPLPGRLLILTRTCEERHRRVFCTVVLLCCLHLNRT